jgi:general nucleoside transport system permease protein
LSIGLPSSVAPMLQGAILFFLLGGEVLTRYRLRWGSDEATALSASPEAANG